MVRLDPRAAQLLAVILALVALVGFTQGLAQALKAPRPEQVAGGVDPSRDPVPNAAALGGPGLDEARVRQIAREEATAALGVAKKKAAAPKAVDDTSDDDNAPVRPRPAASPEPSAPAAPAAPSAPAAAAAPG